MNREKENIFRIARGSIMVSILIMLGIISGNRGITFEEFVVGCIMIIFATTTVSVGAYLLGDIK